MGVRQGTVGRRWTGFQILYDSPRLQNRRASRFSGLGESRDGRNLERRGTKRRVTDTARRQTASPVRTTAAAAPGAAGRGPGRHARARARARPDPGFAGPLEAISPADDLVRNGVRLKVRVPPTQRAVQSSGFAL